MLCQWQLPSFITATEELSKRQLLTAICPNFFLMRQHI
ncbi:hypothetical protein HMPREF1242_1186 [Streptococcus pyogenes GA40884]|nr:hypothetical protein HMPREF1242_1186 [Streptococcus pyogenes GA40884]